MGYFKFILLLVLLGVFLLACSPRGEWHQASRESAGIAPNPKNNADAVLQVYGADAWGWRGWFAIHTWIAAKRSGESEYTLYDVVGWRGYHGQKALRIYQDIPDRHWYGAKPRLLKAHLGEGVNALIDALDQAARLYPWADSYQAFPGPNSNTFTAWIAIQIPELELQLPFSAIGSGYADGAD